jgi:hypothetical protein
MLAYSMWQDTRCQGCGGDLHDTTDIEADGMYVALPPMRCHACAAIAAAQNAFDGQYPSSLMWGVRRRGR